MKKIPALIVLIGLLYSNVYSQKASLAIKVLKTTNYSNNSAEEMQVEDFVTNKFVNTKKFKIVDRSSLNAIESEKDLQTTEAFIDGKGVEQTKSIGANYFIGINIASLDLQRSSSNAYSCKINFTIKVIDIATTEVTEQGVFSGSSGDFMSFIYSPTKAVEKALKQISSKLDDFIEKANFPTSASLSSIEEKDDNGVVKKILISVGSSSNAKAGDKYKVVELSTIDVDGEKKTRKKEIAIVEITNIEDENFSICNVVSGGEEIGKKYAAKKKLRVVLVNQ